MADNGLGKVVPPTQVSSIQAVEGEQEGPFSSSSSFHSYMENASSPTPLSGPSPLSLPQQGKEALPQPTAESVQSQMGSASSLLGDLQTQLTQQDLKLSSAQKGLLKKKMASAYSAIRDAAQQTGVVPPPTRPRSSSNPLWRYADLLEDSQSQLVAAQTKINELSQGGGGLNPGTMLMIQVKLGKAQQELEYCATLLGSATSGVKTIMNIQL